MRKEMKELINIIVGSVVIGVSVTLMLGVVICGLCEWTFTSSIAFWLFMIFFLNFALFLGTSLVYVCNKKMWDNVYDSDEPLQKLIPNLRIFYKFVMFITTR